MSPNDAPVALVMGIGFLAFGLTMVLLPGNVRANVDRFADNWKEGAWHPYRMPFWALRMAGAIVIAVAASSFASPTSHSIVSW